MWARKDRRTRWRGLLVLTLVAALTAGLALASFAGARRTHTAFERLRVHTRGADAIVFPSQVGDYHPDWSPLRRRPEVASLARWFLLFGVSPGEAEETTLFGSVDGAWGTTIDRPVVVRGRMYDPRAADELVVDEDAAKQAHLHVGSVGT